MGGCTDYNQNVSNYCVYLVICDFGGQIKMKYSVRHVIGIWKRRAECVTRRLVSSVIIIGTVTEHTHTWDIHAGWCDVSEIRALTNLELSYGCGAVIPAFLILCPELTFFYDHNLRKLSNCKFIFGDIVTRFTTIIICRLRGGVRGRVRVQR